MLLRPFIQILTNCCKTIFKALEIIYWKAIAVFNLLSTRTLDNTLTVWHDITQTEDQTHLIRHFKLLLLCNNHAKPLTVCHLRMNCSDVNLDAVQLCCSWTGFTGVMKGTCLQLRKSLLQTLNTYTWTVTWPLHWSKLICTINTSILWEKQLYS